MPTVRFSISRTLYYSGLRPEEAAGLRRQDVVLPELVWDDAGRAWTEPGDPWGELHLRTARPDAGKQWTDEGADRDSRGLKHRAEGEIRRVPCPPPLTRLLRDHLALFNGEPAQYLFYGVQGRPLATITYRRA
jgi:integrase